MRIAVTGATGFLGRHFAVAAGHAGHELRLLQRLSVSSGACPPRRSKSAGCAEVEALSRVDALVHLAGAGARADDRDWERMVDANVALPERWARAAAAAGVRRVVFAGSSAEYAGFGTLPGAPSPRAERCVESSPLTDRESYGATKAAGGLLARAAAAELGLGCRYLRLAMLYGPGDVSRRVVPAALDAAASGLPFEATPGEQVRDWLHVDDAVRALLLALEADPPVSPETLNVGTGIGTTLAHVLQRVWTLAGAPPDRLLLGARAYRRDEPHHLVLDPERARARLGFTAAISLERGLERLAREGERPSCG